MLKKIFVVLGLAAAPAGCAQPSNEAPATAAIDISKNHAAINEAPATAAIDISKNYGAINEAANEFLQSFGPPLTKTTSVHIQTDIAGAGSVAGLMLLRAQVPDLGAMKPGDVVISDVYQGQGDLLDFMARVASNMGLESQGDWDTPISKENEPLISTLELTHMLRL